MAILSSGTGPSGRTPYQIVKENGYTGTEEEFNAILATIDKKSDISDAILITIPTSGWSNNRQTFTVTGIPADPTTYEVHLSQVGETNVSAAMSCGLYIIDEAENSLTLGVSEVPSTQFQVYAVVEQVSVN